VLVANYWFMIFLITIHYCSCPGVESRLATLTPDTDDLQKLSGISSRPDMPSTFDISKMATTLPSLFNMLNVRRAILPAANGHCSARALARYYAALADAGVVPQPHSSSSKPPLGSHPHIPKFSSENALKKQKGSKTKEQPAASMKRANEYEQKPDYNDVSHISNANSNGCTRLVDDSSSSNSNSISVTDRIENSNLQKGTASRIFSNPRIHDVFLGVGEYENLVLPNGKFGLGFRRFNSKEGSLVGFGHSGMGGSTGFADMNNRFAIAVTLNKMSFGSVTGKIIQLVCSELNIPVPEEFSRFGESGPDAQLNIGRPLIN
jgi:aarF domain-containing kinase